jgi:signal transduction histidine kinase
MTAVKNMDNAALLERIAQLEAQLNQAHRLTSVGELASTITHEFNNILTTTINYAKMGLRHKDAPTREKAFEKILAASQRAAKITGTVLGLARQNGERREPADLARLVEDTMVLLDREMSKYRVSVESDLRPVPPALVNPGQIQQVLLNLLVNARQAMPNGGKAYVGLRHDVDSDMIELVVRDSGTGIPADKLPRIFEAFYSTKNGPDSSGKGGTGLGLSTCRNIIEAHRGRIRVESTVGRGTAFTLKLPVARTAAPLATTELASEPQPAPPLE